MAEVPEGGTELERVLRRAPGRGLAVGDQAGEGLVPLLGLQGRAELDDALDSLERLAAPNGNADSYPEAAKLITWLRIELAKVHPRLAAWHPKASLSNELAAHLGVNSGGPGDLCELDSRCAAGQGEDRKDGQNHEDHHNTPVAQSHVARSSIAR